MMRIAGWVNVAPFVVIAVATAALMIAGLLWHAPRCTGPTQADRCPLAGSAKVGGFNTSVHTNR